MRASANRGPPGGGGVVTIPAKSHVAVAPQGTLLRPDLRVPLRGGRHAEKSTHMSTMSDKFRGCLLGAAIGDIAGAVVEAESPGYIAAMCRSVDEIIAVESFDEFSGPKWMVGRFTDDTQMMLCVAEWLLNVSASDTRLEFAISNTGLSGRPE